MKFALRRPTEAPEVPGDETPAPPTPPRGRPVVVYAAILDGQTLWLAIEAAPGSLALRDVETGVVVGLKSDLTEDKQAYRSIRVALTDLGGEDERSWEPVLVPSGGGTPKPVWSYPLPEPGPTKIPPSRDGSLQFALQRTDDGALHIARHRRPRNAELRSVEILDTGIGLSLGQVDPEDTHLLVVGKGEVIASFPLTREGDTATCVLSADGLPAGARPFVRLAVGTLEHRRPIHRWRNDLRDPNSAVLPILFGRDDGEARLRLRFERKGALSARLSEPGDVYDEDAPDSEDAPEGDEA